VRRPPLSVSAILSPCAGFEGAARGCFAFIPLLPAVRARVPPSDFKENRRKFKASAALGRSRCRGVKPRGKAGARRECRARRVRAGGTLFRYRLVLIVCEGLTRGSRARQPPPDVVLHTRIRQIYSLARPRRELTLGALSLSLSLSPSRPVPLGGLVGRPALRADRQIGSNTSRLYRVYTGVHQRRKMTYVLRKRVCGETACSWVPFEAT